MAEYSPGSELPPFARWLRRALDQKGLGVRQAAQYIGMSASALSSQLRGETSPNLVTIQKMARFFAVDPEELQELLPRPWHRQAEPLPLPPVRDPKDVLRELEISLNEYTHKRQSVIMVPVLDSVVAAGEGAMVGMETIHYVPQDGERTHSFFALMVKGDCLAPHVRDGDTVIVDRDASPQVGRIVAAVRDGESLLRIYAGDHLESTNTHGAIPLDRSVHLAGVVVFIGYRPGIIVLRR